MTHSEAFQDSFLCDTLTRDALLAANINPDSYLATDYLNHFNEILMLLEMLPEMPEVAEDICAWEPKTYAQHFKDSGFKDKGLAIEAYNNAPDAIKNSFDSLVEEIDSHILDLQAIVASLQPGQQLDPAIAIEINDHLMTILRPALDRANGLIHGSMLENKADDDASGAFAQDAIDELFA
jgi:hypothetical protein